MQGLSTSSAVASTLDQPLVIDDLSVLSRVAGGLGPHGGWSVSAASSMAGENAPTALGPHGGWRTALSGPHGGW